MWEKGNGIKYVKALETPGKKLFKDRLSTLDDERDFTLYSISLLWSSVSIFSIKISIYWVCPTFLYIMPIKFSFCSRCIIL